MGFVLDVAGYGARSVPGRDGVQQRLRRLVVATLADCGLWLDPAVVDHQWTGDGINAILPADIEPTAVLAVLLRSLAAALTRDNAEQADRIRLRMAIGVGLVERSPAGFGGPVIVDINRLVDSAALRSALDDEPAADLAVALSDHAFALIIQPGYPGIPVAQFTRVNVAAKEFSGPAWIWVSTRQWSDPVYLPPGPGDTREAGRYRIVARLGEGQAGTVYLANDGRAGGQDGAGAGAPDGGRDFDGVTAFGGEGAFGGGVFGGEGAFDADGTDADSAAAAGWAAVKVFDPTLMADPDVRRRLPVGALAASVIRHPHLASVIDCGAPGDRGASGDRGQRWVASTLVRGPSLAAAVRETGPLPAQTPGWLALGVAGALAMLHESGLAHHAVSAENVLLSGHGPVLTDFGTNRAALIAGPGTAADDVLMLGATAFFAATGRSPWAGLPAPLVTGIRMTASAPPGESDLDGCPPWLAPIVLACLAADPAERPTAERLHSWLLGEVGRQPRSWLPDPVATRVAECQVLPSPRGRPRWPRGRES